MSEDKAFQDAQPQQEPPRVVTRAPGCLWMLASGALVVAVISLLINLVFVAALLERRAALQTAVDQMIVALDDASGNDVTFNFPISQTVAFEGDVPLRQDLDFPFKADVHINTTIRVPIDLGPLLGQQVVNVPVDTVVPVDTSVPVHIDQTFHVNTQVPVRVDVPVVISPRQPPWRDWLEQVREWLVSLRDQI